jgi:hypothetical protein
MPPPEPATPDESAVAFADLDHVVRNALMIIQGRAHRLQRLTRQTAALTAERSTFVQRDLAAIDAAVVALVIKLDALGL